MQNPFRRRSKNPIGVVVSDNSCLCVPGYTSLDKNPEVMTAARRIAELIGTLTIHLMRNTDRGDERIVNELSRLIDINPMPNMTRKQWIESIVMTMLLSGRGNAIVIPHTRAGYLRSLEPVASYRTAFRPIGFSDYKVEVDGRQYDPDEVIHFTFNPDLTYLWKGQGISVQLKDIANNLKQAAATKKAFLESKWKPSVIIRVDANTATFQTKDGRKKILDDYISTDEAGEPWIIPGELVDVQTIKPLTLADLAISDTVEIDKRMVAAIFGEPAFMVGVGDYNKDAWNAFVTGPIKAICTGLQQELTKKLILSPDWYLRFNWLSLMDWDLKTIADVFGALSDRGFVTGNEVRDRIGMTPIEGLDETRILENYIPYDMSGNQKKLIQEGGNSDD